MAMTDRVIVSRKDIYQKSLELPYDDFVDWLLDLPTIEDTSRPTVVVDTVETDTGSFILEEDEFDIMKRIRGYHNKDPEMVAAIDKIIQACYTSAEE